MQTVAPIASARPCALPCRRSAPLTGRARVAAPVVRIPKQSMFESGVPRLRAETLVAAAVTTVVAPPSQQVQQFGLDPLAEVAGLFDRWNGALQTLEPSKVADCYAPDAVLLPTVSNIVRTDRDAIIDYFRVFLKLKPRGVIDESQVRILGKDVAANSGVYTFTIEKDGKDVKVQARFSFIYKKVNGEWKIAEHHSSAMPEHAEVAAQFDKWNAALATLDPHKVADCYGPGAVLLPTVSNQVRTNRAAIVDYFTNFLKLKPQGVIDETNVRVLANGVAMYAGIYTFTITKDGTPTKVQARFSFTYKKFGGEYKIVEHHSSAMPEPVLTPAAANARNN